MGLRSTVLKTKKQKTDMYNILSYTVQCLSINIPILLFIKTAATNLILSANMCFFIKIVHLRNYFQYEDIKR